MQGLSERQYASHVGLSRGAVQKAKSAGRLVFHPDGSIDPVASDARRASMTDPSQQRAKVAPERDAGVSLLSVWMARRARWARVLMEEFRSLLGGLTSRDILLIASLSSLGEELFFRGVLLPGLGHVLGSQWLGLTASSLIFGLLHVPASRRMIPWTLQAVAMGFVLGFLYLFTGDLTVCVATHFVINQRNLTIVQTWKD